MKPLLTLLCLFMFASPTWAFLGGGGDSQDQKQAQGQLQGQAQGQIAKAEAEAKAAALAASKSKSSVKNSGNSISASGVLGSGNSENKMKNSGNSALDNSFDIRGDTVVYEDSAESAAAVYAATCTTSTSIQTKLGGFASANETQQCIELRQSSVHAEAYLRTKDKRSDQAKYHLERMHYFRTLADESAESGHWAAKFGKIFDNLWKPISIVYLIFA